MLRAFIIMPIALKASVMMEPWGGRTTYDFRRRMSVKMPMLNIQKQSRKAVQKPSNSSMNGVATSEREPKLMHQ